MAKNQIASAMRHMEKMNKKLDETKIQIQSDCPHHAEENMSLTLVKLNGPDHDTATRKDYKCTNCRKIVNIRAFNEGEIKDAIDMVDSMLDIIKIKCDLTKEADRKAFKIAAKMQYWVRAFLKAAYESACKNNGKNKKNRNNSSGTRSNSSTIWDRPSYK